MLLEPDKDTFQITMFISVAALSSDGAERAVFGHDGAHFNAEAQQVETGMKGQRRREISHVPIAAASAH